MTSPPDTVEDRLLELQEKKRLLASAALGQDVSAKQKLNKLSEKDILYLFSAQLSLCAIFVRQLTELMFRRGQTGPKTGCMHRSWVWRLEGRRRPASLLLYRRLADSMLRLLLGWIAAIWDRNYGSRSQESRVPANETPLGANCILAVTLSLQSPPPTLTRLYIRLPTPIPSHVGARLCAVSFNIVDVNIAKQQQ